MNVERNVGGRDRLFRALLAIVLAVVAARAIRGGRRKTALLAVVGSVGFGINAAICFCSLNRVLDIDTTRD